VPPVLKRVQPFANPRSGCEAGEVAENGLHQMTFDLDEIRSVFFRCNGCRTAVSFPRIRWANLPERCPNCGASWMQEPSSEFGAPEDNSMKAFAAVKAFRDALQALISVSRTAGFTVGLETVESSDAEETIEKPVGPGTS
jgi:hypothetical protein